MDDDLVLAPEEADLTRPEIFHLSDQWFGQRTAVVGGVTDSGVECGSFGGGGRDERREPWNAARDGNRGGGERAAAQEVSTTQARSPTAKWWRGLVTPIRAHGYLRSALL